ncbi:MAG: bacteriohemerythrin [Magnetovibrionaceae bacterium]
MTGIHLADDILLLGRDDMDETHRSFVELVNKASGATGQDFAEAFAELVAHTKEHFAHEEALMVESDFPAIGEHKADHARVLGDLDRFSERVAKGRWQFAKAYVTDQVPGWFQLHLITMDQALASHLAS